MKHFKESPLSIALDLQDNELGSFYQSLSIDDRLFVKGLISHFPREVQEVLIEQYQSFEKPFNANTYLRHTREKIDAILPEKLRNYFGSGEDDLREAAEENAQRCKRIEIYVVKSKTGNSLTDSDSVNGISDVYAACAKLVNGFGINPPEESNVVTLTGAVRRMQDKYWWLRKLRKVLTQKRENVFIALGQVNSRKGKYCSDFTFKFRQLQIELQRKMLENLVIVNEEDDSFSLAELSDKNVSNPVNRKNELMTRMAGFEQISKDLGHKALFVTITCPSRFHNTYAKSGDRNPKWDGSTPYDGQQYLNSMWSRIRAEFDRQGITQYGFRVAEPQHDGTPHWHMLIFIEPHHMDAYKQVVIEHALREDGDEAGATENRCDFKEIDYKRGSATGYIAKYVSKNINGKNLDSDIDGGDATHAAQRVNAWASCWSIRQFQQIGKGSVTVWRELRRLRHVQNFAEGLKKIHTAADSGSWSEFVTLMGGVFCKRDEQAVRPLYLEKVDETSGEIKQSYFDGVITHALKGVRYGEQEIITRVREWRIEHSSERAA